MLRVRISSNDGEFDYKKVNFIKIEGEDFIINYQDENDEKCEEIGSIPGDLIVDDPYDSLCKVEELLKQATSEIYGHVDEKKACRAFNSIQRFTDIMSIDDLLAYDADKILYIKGVGPTSFDIIMKAICLAKEKHFTRQSRKLVLR